MRMIGCVLGYMDSQPFSRLGVSMLGDITGGLAAAIFLAVVANKLIDGLIKPAWERAGLDNFYLLYVSWLVGGLLVWLSGVNLFAAIIPQALVGQVLTAIVAGGGASMLHDLFDLPEVILEDGGDPDDGIPF